jgi:lipopolysaccharide/colanic/teichoic acid biosynthesis glycosyltransferase
MADRIGGQCAVVQDGAGIRSADWQSGENPRPAEIRFRIVPAISPIGGSAKRCFDVVLSVLLLPLAAVLGLPVVCLIALNGGAAIYGHLRIGWNGKIFRCYKFRTMVADAEDELQAILERDPVTRLQWLEHFKLENDPRVTPLGRFLRDTNLDEIPQLWNVLRGEMSWVGPRPVVADELNKYGAHLSAYFACRPGITGSWQIRRCRDTTYDQRVAYDVEYVRHWSMARDIMILIRTVRGIIAVRHRE